MSESDIRSYLGNKNALFKTCAFFLYKFPHNEKQIKLAEYKEKSVPVPSQPPQLPPRPLKIVEGPMPEPTTRPRSPQLVPQALPRIPLPGMVKSKYTHLSSGNNNSNTYEQKYLKYKQKYLELKKLMQV